jgi:hypothetical protein
MRLAAALTDGLAAWALAISSTKNGSPKLCHQLASAATEPWCGKSAFVLDAAAAGSGLYHWLATGSLTGAVGAVAAQAAKNNGLSRQRVLLGLRSFCMWYLQV